MIDRWSSAGLAVPQQLSDNDHFHHLPMPELKFWHLKQDDPQSEEHYHSEIHGLWGYMIMLARIFGHIQNLHKSLADGALNDMEAEQRTRNLAHELERYLDLLPLEVHFSVENLKNHAALGLGRAFVALHLGYHHYATLLYFPYLDHQQRETPNRAMYSSRCKHHAVQFSDILRLSHEVEECEALYFIVGHMTVVSSAALIHTLLFGQQEELPQTRSRLCDNFAILLKLREYWPAVELMVSPPKSFRKSWLISISRLRGCSYFKKCVCGLWRRSTLWTNGLSSFYSSTLFLLKSFLPCLLSQNGASLPTIRYPSFEDQASSQDDQSVVILPHVIRFLVLLVGGLQIDILGNMAVIAIE